MKDSRKQDLGEVGESCRNEVNFICSYGQIQQLGNLESGKRDALILKMG